MSEEKKTLSAYFGTKFYEIDYFPIDTTARAKEHLSRLAEIDYNPEKLLWFIHKEFSILQLSDDVSLANYDMEENQLVHVLEKAEFQAFEQTQSSVNVQPDEISLRMSARKKQNEKIHSAAVT